MIARFTSLVAGLPATVPFVGPETLERQRSQPFTARLGANENGFGPSPKAVAAMREAAGMVWRYGDPTSHDLREALAEHHGVAVERIAIGEGIDGLLANTVRLFVEPGTAVVTSEGAYPTFSYHVAGFGGVLHKVPYKDDAEDAEALAEAAHRHRARLVYFANPDNPMGLAQSAETVTRLLKALPSDCLLCLDEAYIELAPEGTAPPWSLDDPRLIRFRTFSKAHGMAGLRLGYAVADPQIVQGFERIRNHFGVNRMAQTAALAALGDQAHLQAVCLAVAKSRTRLSAIAAENGLKALPSAANFVAIDCGRDGAFARTVLDALLGRGVFVRMPGVAPLDRCIRLTCGPEPEMDVFARALPQALAEARAHVADPAPV
ncbi:MAG: pyridoxal phosphate-dependent aminotransferase [Pseudomonadota bacterium]